MTSFTADKQTEIAARIASRQAEVDDFIVARIAAGFTHGGHAWDVDQVAQQNFSYVKMALVNSEVSPHGGTWRNMANVDVTLNDTQMEALADASKTYVFDLRTNGFAHKDALGALTTLATIDSYDITTGWPQLITVNAWALTLTGVAPTLITAIPVPTGALTLTGVAPTLT